MVLLLSDLKTKAIKKFNHNLGSKIRDNRYYSKFEKKLLKYIFENEEKLKQKNEKSSVPFNNQVLREAGMLVTKRVANREYNMTQLDVFTKDFTNFLETFDQKGIGSETKMQ